MGRSKRRVFVSTHSRPKAAGKSPLESEGYKWFQHTAARRRLASTSRNHKNDRLFQHTAARRRLAVVTIGPVSTPDGFNTQPPEGGWGKKISALSSSMTFQHTAARRRLGLLNLIFFCIKTVSTHSRPKAAG